MIDKKQLKEEMISWRHELHQHPEAAFEEVNTAKYIAEKLRSWGYEVEEHVGKTGVVGKMKLGTSDKVVALRSDIDCICTVEQTGLPYASRTEGRMHACGHDGHITTLLGAAKIIAEEKAFDGTVVLVFQPAEEPGYGADAMIADGLIERYGIREIYGQHNGPQLPLGKIVVPTGSCLSAEDDFIIKIHGKGGHASGPHNTKDALLVGMEIVAALQTIVSRNIDPLKTAVVSCTEFHTDGVHNAIPSNVTIEGDCRSYDPEVSLQIEERMGKIVRCIAEMNDVDYEFGYSREFIATINDPGCAAEAKKAADAIFGPENVTYGDMKLTFSEDFAKYLQKVPGCFCFVGSGDAEHDKPLHHAQFNYNDEALLPAAEWFAQIIKVRMA